jgi:hypothetical protein
VRTAARLLYYEVAPTNVRFGSKADIEALNSMSALPPKADIG